MSNWQYPNMGLDNGLAPNRRQAIIWTNVDPIHWRIYAALRGDELKYCVCVRKCWLTHYKFKGQMILLYNICGNLFKKLTLSNTFHTVIDLNAFNMFNSSKVILNQHWYEYRQRTLFKSINFNKSYWSGMLFRVILKYWFAAESIHI